MSNISKCSGADMYAVIDFSQYVSLSDTPPWWQNFVAANRSEDRSKNWTTTQVNRRLRKYSAWIVEQRDDDDDVAAVYFRTEGGMVQFMLTYA